eukprot:scaffold33373_cov124-Isochrysis_galbana.AAC.1
MAAALNSSMWQPLMCGVRDGCVVDYDVRRSVARVPCFRDAYAATSGRRRPVASRLLYVSRTDSYVYQSPRPGLPSHFFSRELDAYGGWLHQCLLQLDSSTGRLTGDTLMGSPSAAEPRSTN